MTAIINDAACGGRNARTLFVRTESCNIAFLNVNSNYAYIHH